MAGETAVETPAVQDNKIEEQQVKSDKEAIVEEEKEAQLNEEKKDEEKKEDSTEKPAPKKEAEKAKKFPVHKQDFEKDVVYLYLFNRRTPAIPSIEPCCLKVESWLKFHGIKYENIDHKMKLRSKRGQLPFVELNGEEICDSSHIIDVLSKTFDKQMPMELNAEQKQIQHAMNSMVENHFNWTVVHWRSKDINSLVKGYKMDLSSTIGYKLPASVLNFIVKHTYLRKGQKKMKAQGFGNSTNEEIEEFGKSDMKVLSDKLGDKEFMFGEEPSLLDLTVYSHLAPVAFVDKEYPCALRDYMESDCQNLVGLVNRMKDRCWGDDWAKATGEEQELNPHIPKPVPAEPEKKEEEEKKESEDKKEESDKEEKKTEKEEEKKEEEKETADEKKDDKEEKN